MATENGLYAYSHQKIVPLKEAFLHVSDLAIQRGYGVFDFFLVENGQPVFLEDYLDRFYQSASLMLLPVPLGREALRNTIMELIRLNDLPLSGVKLLLTGGYSANGYEPSEPNLIITQQPLELPDMAQVERGINVITHAYQREVPLAKTINYTMGIRLISEIRAQGADDVLYHQVGVVTEFPRANFFIVKQDNTIATPAHDVLQGITRKKVLELAAGAGYPVEEGIITLADIREAKEAFMTSTTRQIVPVVQLNNTPIGNGRPGEVTLTLLQQLEALKQKTISRR